MRHLAAVALLATLAACGGEKSSGEAGGEVAMLNTTPDPEGETGEEVSSSEPTPVAASGYNTADIPPYIDVYAGARKLTATREQRADGRTTYLVKFLVDAPHADVVDFYRNSLRSKGFLLNVNDAHMQRRGWVDITFGRSNIGSNTAYIIAQDNGAGPIAVEFSGVLLEAVGG